MNELDEAAQRAHEMIRFHQEDCRKRCEPYLKILADIESLRPRCYYTREGDFMVPFLPEAQDVTQR